MYSTKMYFRYLFICLIACSLPTHTFSKGTLGTETGPSDTMLYHFLKKAVAYPIRTPQEKVYLHLDNNGYFQEETIWFKAYVVQASTLRPSSLSRVLYVDLLSPEGETIEHKLLYIEHGTAYGDFSLKGLPHGGYYEIRAYTREMLNWDDACVFSRVIPIFDSPRETGNYNELTIYESPATYHVPSERPLPAKIKGNCQMTFYPEGGSRVKGLDNRIAFQLTDKKGMPLQAECRLYTQDGELMTTFSPVHEGRGRFTIPASATECYVAVMNEGKVSERFPVPHAEAGRCGLTLQNKNTDTLEITLQGGNDFYERTVGIYGSCRGMACYFDTAYVGQKPVTVQIPRKSLRPGVNQLTVYDTKGMVLAERLIFQMPSPTDRLQMEVKQNATLYGTASPIALEMYLKDSQGKPVHGTFSLSVRDNAGETVTPQTDICTDLLLCSDLKGYIHHPEFYFQANDSMRQEALDLLLCVQGWKRYDWQEMVEVKPFQLKHPIEEGLLLEGSVLKKGKPVPNVQLNLYMFIQAGASMKGKCKSDSTGRYAFMPQAFIGDWIGRITTSVGGKNKNFQVTLNRNFEPALRYYAPQELLLQSPIPITPEAVSAITTFQWNDTLPKGNIMRDLKEVKITANRYLGHQGNRYSYGGGEDYGRRHANIFYNLRKETERCWNAGEDTPMFIDWLSQKNKYFYYDISDINGTTNYNLIYKGRKVVLYLDNEPYKFPPTFFLEELKSAVIVEKLDRLGISATANLTVEKNATDRPTAALLLYSDENAMYFQKNRGRHPFRLQGYALPKTFVSPNYRLMELPQKGDFRRTLYWNPNISTDDQGKAGVAFFGNSRNELSLRISAQGILDNGTMIHYER